MAQVKNRQGINGEGVNSQVESNTEKEYEKAQNMQREFVFPFQ